MRLTKSSIGSDPRESWPAVRRGCIARVCVATGMPREQIRTPPLCAGYKGCGAPQRSRSIQAGRTSLGRPHFPALFRSKPTLQPCRLNRCACWAHAAIPYTIFHLVVSGLTPMSLVRAGRADAPACRTLPTAATAEESKAGAKAKAPVADAESAGKQDKATKGGKAADIKPKHK
eukprot:327534-Chlamydomonas_euryale.AAC.2